HGRSVLERIAYCIADNCGIVQRRALLLHLNFDDLLRIVPRATGIGHENRLEQSEYGDRDQIADKEERLDERKSQRSKEDCQKDIEHPLLRVLRANFNDLLAIFD